MTASGALVPAGLKTVTPDELSTSSALLREGLTDTAGRASTALTTGGSGRVVVMATR
jgi:hypothetical protein